MNNSIIVTDRSLAYYDDKIKGYGSCVYGSDMTVEWEPMENGKNYFKLKIALKNRNGSELFAKIVDFPLEQTIVSGSYEKETKSLLLYFQDGSSTKIPIEDLIDGLASKLDLEAKADKGSVSSISGVGCEIPVPDGVSKYTRISKIGGMSYKSKNLTVQSEDVIERNGITFTKNADGSITVNGTATAQAYNTMYVENLPNGTYSFNITRNGSSTAFVYISFTDGTGATVRDGHYSFEITDNKKVSYIILNANSGTTISNETWYVMLSKGDTALPYEPYFSGLRDTRVTSVKSVGANLWSGEISNKTAPTTYSFENGTLTLTRNGGSIQGCVWSKEIYKAGTYTISFNLSGVVGVNFCLSSRVEPSTTSIGSNITSWYDNGKHTYTFTLTEDRYIGFYTDGSGMTIIASELIINKGNTALPYIPYTEHTVAIPEAAQSLEGYGQGNPDNPQEYNYIDWDGSKFVAVGKVADGVWTAYASPKETDICLSGIVKIEGGGKIILENENGDPVPWEAVLYPEANELIASRDFVGDLTGIATASEYYTKDGGISGKSIGTELTEIKARLTEAENNFIRLTRSQIPVKSTVGVTATTVMSNIINSEGVSVNELIIDKYMEDGVSYLCFWQITGFAADTIEMKGLGAIYVGGGSASIADQAVKDGSGRVITETYAEKAYAEALDNAQVELSARLDDADTEIDSILNKVSAIESGGAANVSLEWLNEPTYVMKIALKTAGGNEIASDIIDLPLEGMVVNATYDGDEQVLLLELKNGYITPVPVFDIFKGLVTNTNIGEKKAGSAVNADSAIYATRAYNDGDGNLISATYGKRSETAKSIGYSWENPGADGVNPFKLNISLINANGASLNSIQIDFPLEQMVIGAEYDEETQNLILHTLDGAITVPVSDIFKGLVTDTNIGEKKAGFAGVADKTASFVRSDGTVATVESVEGKAVAAGNRANEAYALAKEAKSLADSFDTSKASQSEVDELSQAQSDFGAKIQNGDIKAHTAKYAPGNTSYTLENAIRSVTLSDGKLSLIRFNAAQGSVDLLSRDYISSLATALASNGTFINAIVEAVLKEMGY